MCIALGVPRLDDISKEIESLFKMLAGPKESILDKLRVLPKLSQFAAWMPKVDRGKGECQEVILETPDLCKTSHHYLLAKRRWSFHHPSGNSYQGSGNRNSECGHVPDAANG